MSRQWGLGHYQPDADTKSAEQDGFERPQNQREDAQFVSGVHSRHPIVQNAIDFCAVFAWFVLALFIINSVGFSLFYLLEELFQ